MTPEPPSFKQENFCCVGDYSVLIPYKDLEKMVNLAKKSDELVRRYQRLEKKVDALYNLYLETLEKVSEMNKML